MAIHHDGTWKRNDYIGVSCSLPLQVCATWIPEEIDFSLVKEDHRPLFARLTWKTKCSNDERHKKQPKLKSKRFDGSALQELSKKAALSFDLDVHTHAWQMQDALLGCCQRHTRASSRKPRHLSSTSRSGGSSLLSISTSRDKLRLPCVLRLGSAHYMEACHLIRFPSLIAC